MIGVSGNHRRSTEAVTRHIGHVDRPAAARSETGACFSLKRPYWQPYWWRLLFRADDSSGWEAMGPQPLHQVPSDALKSASIEA